MTPAPVQPAHWNIFFSSCFTDAQDVALGIRARVADRFNEGGDKPVWMAEDFRVLDPLSPVAPVDKALFCVKGVRHSDAYVAVVIDKHGSGIELAPRRSTQASFLELELFEAAVSGRPAFVYILKGHEPTGRMEALLNLLAPALPGLCREPLDEDEILRRVERVLYQTRHPRLSRLTRFRASSPVAHDRLGAARHRPYDPSIGLPALQFLGDPYDPTLGPPSPDLAEKLLAMADGEDDQQSKLTMVWLALRELMGARPGRAVGDRVLACWDSALGKWGSAAAWYGLHGFCLMGCVGAISSRARVLREFATPPPAPHGPFASEYYSIAKKVGDPRLRKMFLELALNHCDVVIRGAPDTQALAIRGSVYWQLGRRAEAIADYEKNLELRENAGAAPASIGEARAELGFALVRNGATRRRGLTLLEEGVEEASRFPPNGFLVRAKRKLGLGYLRSGSPRLALGELVGAHDMAVANGLFDQIGPVERAAKRVDRLLPFLKRPH